MAFSLLWFFFPITKQIYLVKLLTSYSSNENLFHPVQKTIAFPVTILRYYTNTISLPGV